MEAKVNSKRQRSWVMKWAHVTDTVFAEGTDAIRRVAGSSVGLMMSEGLSVKELSEWLADADEGLPQAISIRDLSIKATYPIFYQAFLVTCMTDCIAVMSDKMADKTFNKKDFLQYEVRELSRLLVGKTNGQELIWKMEPPPYWPAHLKWKNPTSTPKDTVAELEEKFNFLKQNVSRKCIPEDQQTILRLYEKHNFSEIPYVQNIFKTIESLRHLNPPSEACQDTLDTENRLLLVFKECKTNISKRNENSYISNNSKPMLLPKDSVDQSNNSSSLPYNAQTTVHANNALLYFIPAEAGHVTYNPQNNNIVVLAPILNSVELKHEKSVTVTKRKLEISVSEMACKNSTHKRRTVSANMTNNNNVVNTENIETSHSSSTIVGLPMPPNTVSNVDYQGLQQVATATDLDNISYSQPASKWESSQICNIGLPIPASCSLPLLSPPTTSEISCPQILSPSTPTSTCTSVSNGGHSPAHHRFQDVGKVSTPSTQRSNDSGHESEDSLDKDYSTEDWEGNSILSELQEVVQRSDEEIENMIDLDDFYNFY